MKKYLLPILLLAMLPATAMNNKIEQIKSYITQNVHLEDEQKIIIIGSHERIISGWLAEQYPTSFIATIDKNTQKIIKAIKTCENHHYNKLVFIDVEPWKFKLNNSFDLALSFGKLHTIAYQQDTLNAIAQHLDKKGVLHLTMCGRDHRYNLIDAWHETIKSLAYAAFFDRRKATAFKLLSRREIKAQLAKAGFISFDVAKKMHEKTFSDHQQLSLYIHRLIKKNAHTEHMKKLTLEKFSRAIASTYLRKTGYYDAHDKPVIKCTNIQLIVYAQKQSLRLSAHV